ncbi:MAG: NFACT family protein [Anaerolineae bacterium]
MTLTLSEAQSFPEAGRGSLKIALDPALSASENAQEYFNRYRRALRASDEIPAQQEKITLEENYLEQLEQDLAMAEDRPEIDTVAEELAGAGFFQGSGRASALSKVTAVICLTAPSGATVLVGKNALQNAHLTFDKAAPDDLWLHARGVPGAHVIIPTARAFRRKKMFSGRREWQAYYSRAPDMDTSVEVDVTVKVCAGY